MDKKYLISIRRIIFIALSVGLLIWPKLVFSKEVSDLRLFINLWTSEGRRLTTEEVMSFKGFLREDDLIFAHVNVRNMDSIKEVGKGNLVVSRGSYDQLVEELAFAQSQKLNVDYIAYNLEGFATHRAPEDEKQNPLESTRKARDLADENKLGLIISPDQVHHLPFWKDLVQLTDIFHLETQRHQLLSVEAFYEKIKQQVELLRESNPQIIIFVQFSTHPPTHGRVEGGEKIKSRKSEKEVKQMSVEDIIERVDAIKDLVDGVGFLVYEKDEGWQNFLEILKVMRPEGH